MSLTVTASSALYELCLQQQMGISKQGQQAINKVRQAEDEDRHNRLAELDVQDENNLSEPLLDHQ